MYEHESEEGLDDDDGEVKEYVGILQSLGLGLENDYFGVVVAVSFDNRDHDGLVRHLQDDPSCFSRIVVQNVKNERTVEVKKIVDWNDADPLEFVFVLWNHIDCMNHRHTETT